jgi:hypothetical protein
MEARGSRKRIRQTHLTDQVTDLQGNCRTPGCGLVTFPCPINPEPFSLPRDHRFGLHYEQRRTPARAELGQPHPEETIMGREADTPFLRPTKDYDLVAQGDDLRLDLQAALKPGTEEGK